MPGRHHFWLLAALGLSMALSACSGTVLHAPRAMAGPGFSLPAQHRVELRLDQGQLSGAQPTPEMRAWIDEATQAIGVYYGYFPVEHARLLVDRVGGSGVRWARTFANSGAYIRVGVGEQTTSAEFASDWILTHEFVHLALPQLADEHDWLQEGAATYVEPIARAQAGYLSPERVWAEFALNMAHGLPASDDRGLDFTPTWARTYWGGALFCLMADVKIRIRTGNRVGLQQALQAILRAGGTLEHRWPIRDALKAADEATGVDVLTQMYEQWRATPVEVDLPKLWRELGVEQYERRVLLHDDAPLAEIRRAITTRIPESRPQTYAGG